MKTICFKTEGADRFFTPSGFARRPDETEEEFFHRSAKKVVPDGVSYEIVEDAIFRDMTSEAREPVPSYTKSYGSCSSENDGQEIGEAGFIHKARPSSIALPEKSQSPERKRRKKKKRFGSIFISIKKVNISC